MQEVEQRKEQLPRGPISKQFLMYIPSSPAFAGAGYRLKAWDSLILYRGLSKK
jgi:hypothetical protein